MYKLKLGVVFDSESNNSNTFSVALKLMPQSIKSPKAC